MLSTNPELASRIALDENRLAIYKTIGAIPNYPTYMSGQQLQTHFRQLEDKYSGDRDVIAKNEPIMTRDDTEVNMLVVAPKGVPVKRRVLVVNSVHTNETAGSGTFQFLPEYACENPALLKQLGNCMLLFIDADPEGMALNGPALMKGQPTLEEYMFDGYRSGIQAAWDHTWPQRGHKSMLPGTQAVEKAIAEYAPKIIAPLHNAAMGNPHTFITRESTTLVSDIKQLRKFIRRHSLPGKADAPWIQELGENSGVYGGVSARQIYDHYKKYNPNEPVWPHAESSVGYHSAQVLDAFGIMDESPYFTTPSVADTRPASTSIRDLVEALNRRTASIIDQAEEIRTSVDLEKIAPTYLPLATSIDYLVRVYRNELELGTKDIPDEPATRGTANDRIIRKIAYPSRVLGQAGRLAKLAGDEQAFFAARKTIRQNIRELHARIGNIFTSTPREMIGMQVGTILVALLADKEGTLEDLVI